MNYVYFVAYNFENKGITGSGFGSITLKEPITKLEHVVFISEQMATHFDGGEATKIIITNYILLRTE